MQKTSWYKRFLRDKSGPLLILLIVLMLFTMVISSGVTKGEKPFTAIFTDGFMASGNLLGIFYNLVIQIVMMCGIAMILIGGNIDLSVGAQAMLAAMIFANLIVKTMLPWPVCLLITLIIAAGFGLINTILINLLHFPAFIATIGMSSVYKGLCNVMNGGNNVQILSTRAQGFLDLGKASLFGRFPVIFLFALVLVVVYQFVLSRTRFGRSVYMSGGNPPAARLSGLNPNKIRMILFVNNSVLAAIGGLLWTAQLTLASPTAIAASAPDMKVISGSILGGVSFMGGAGHLGGALIALFLLNIFNNMLRVLNVQDYWTTFAAGFLLVVALIVDYISAERRRKALLAEKNA
ncbi:MAG: ABC transporter permease [Oscillospiraceae bacterium]|jgi:ribose/xylose/arabinose/galactoside ABC-type transport system permease subunit|nr:ABC transporter permease [Oscillospiraceae bacterium]